MKILVLTRDGTALGLAQRLVQEGHDVDVFSDTLKLTHTGKDIYKVSHNLWASVQECKFIVSDSGDWPNLYKRAEMYNKPIIGCHPMTDMLNADCVKEFKLGQRLGIGFPKTEVFTDAAGLQPKLLEGSNKRYYVKIGRSTFVCTQPEWMAWAMYQLPVGQEVLLQEEVHGEEMSIIGWFNGLNWVKPFFYATPNYDKIGGVAMLAQKEHNRLSYKTLYPLQKWLRVIDYKGPVTANLIVNAKDTFVKRFRLGLTAPCVFAMMEGLRSLPCATFLSSLAFGSDQEVDMTKDYLLGIEVGNKDGGMHGAPLLGLEEKNLSKVFLQGVCKDNDRFVMSGEIPAVYTAVAHGRDMREAALRVYRTIDNVQFPRMRYITNIQGQSMGTFNSLKNWGII